MVRGCHFLEDDCPSAFWLTPVLSGCRWYLVLSCHSGFFLHHHPRDPFHFFHLCWISCFPESSVFIWGFLPCFGRANSFMRNGAQQVSFLRSCLSQNVFNSPQHLMDSLVEHRILDWILEFRILKTLLHCLSTSSLNVKRSEIILIQISQCCALVLVIFIQCAGHFDEGTFNFKTLSSRKMSCKLLISSCCPLSSPSIIDILDPRGLVLSLFVYFLLDFFNIIFQFFLLRFNFCLYSFTLQGNFCYYYWQFLWVFCSILLPFYDGNVWQKIK